MLKIKILLYKSIEKKGLNHPMTIALSQLLDKEIVKQQLQLNALVKNRYIEKAIEYNSFLERRAEIIELARRLNNEQSFFNWKIN